MTTKPILFSTEMVKAILEGRKTETRRVMKPQLPQMTRWQSVSWDDGRIDILYRNGQRYCVKCPYGQPGDLLWVRETWATPGNYDHIKPSDLGASNFNGDVIYRATDPFAISVSKWRPSIFMPRWASRITLKVVDIRVERLQDITQDSAKAEGARSTYTNREGGPSPWWYYYIDGFQRLWDSINSKRGFGWDVNPWVWVVKFEATP